MNKIYALILLLCFLCAGLVENSDHQKDMSKRPPMTERQRQVAEFMAKQGSPELLGYPTKEEIEKWK